MWAVRVLWTMSLFFVFRGTCNMRGMKQPHHRRAICIRSASPVQMGSCGRNEEPETWMGLELCREEFEQPNTIYVPLFPDVRT